jgi:methionyl-tRNA synthetase
VLNSNFGNLVNRILKLFKDYELPNIPASDEVINKIKETKEKVCNSLEKVEIKNYVNSFCSLIDFSNKYLSIKAPWKNKDNLDEFNQTMIDCFYLLVAIDILIKPLLIKSSEKIEQMLNIQIDY